MTSQSMLFTEPTPAPAPAEPIRALHASVATIPLPAGRVLRVARADDRVILASGFTDDDVLRALANGITMPLSAVPALVRALEELAG
jgi:hypothetical protein